MTTPQTPSSQPTYETPITVSFQENVRGWVSFKSFVPENGVSCSNKYYTFKQGALWAHDSETRNTFYSSRVDSSFTVVLNDLPGSIKSFATLNYEGSGSRVEIPVIPSSLPFAGLPFDDGQYYNLSQEPGWYVSNINTDKENGSLDEFIEKEGKWFNYIKGKNINANNSGHVINEEDFDVGSFSTQGLGRSSGFVIPVSVGGCTDSQAFNYNPLANFGDGSCVAVVDGCMETSANNYAGPGNLNLISPPANTDNNSCKWYGCTNTAAFNYNAASFPSIAFTYNNGYGMTDDGSCVAASSGCTDPTAMNYNAGVNIDNGSCVYQVTGCVEADASNYDPLANTASNNCFWEGCTNPLASNYVGFSQVAVNWSGAPGSGIIDDGSCSGGGCMDDGYNTLLVDGFDSAYPGYPNANYDSLATFHVPGDCANAWTGVEFGCTWDVAANFNPLATHMDPNSPTPSALIPGSSCVVIGCTNPSADNYGCPSSVNTNPSLALNFAASFNWPYNVLGHINGSGTATVTAPANSDCSTAHQDTLDDGTIVNVIAEYPDNVIVSGYPPSAFTDSCIITNPGCTSATACNFDPLATNDDGSCNFEACSGCTDSTADNYNVSNFSNATTNNGCYVFGSSLALSCTITCGNGINNSNNPTSSCCTYTTYGCTDPSYCNYDSNATVDDGSCNSSQCSGCLDGGGNTGGQGNATNYDPTATYDCVGVAQVGTTVGDTGCCNYANVYGCMDPTACNYDSFANVAGNYNGIINSQNQQILNGIAYPGLGKVSATNDSNPCLYPITNVTIGGNHAAYNLATNNQRPVYYQAQNWFTGTSSVGQQGLYPSVSDYTKNFVISAYNNPKHIGLRFTAEGINKNHYTVGSTSPYNSQTITGTSNSIKATLQQLDYTNTNAGTPFSSPSYALPVTYNTIHTKTWNANLLQTWSNGEYPDVWGYPWGSSLTASSNQFFFPHALNYDFFNNNDGTAAGSPPDTYTDAYGVIQNLDGGTTNRRWYRLMMTQTIGGIEFGATYPGYTNAQGVSTPASQLQQMEDNFPACGVEVFFAFDIRPCADFNGTTSLGCMDSTACTYDSTATCHDQSQCSYGTLSGFYCNNNACTPVGCTGNTPVFSSMSNCANGIPITPGDPNGGSCGPS